MISFEDFCESTFTSKIKVDNEYIDSLNSDDLKSVLKEIASAITGMDVKALYNVKNPKVAKVFIFNADKKTSVEPKFHDKVSITNMQDPKWSNSQK